MHNDPDPHPAFGHHGALGHGRRPDAKGEGKPLEVAAGVITDAQGRVLLMQRLPGKHLAGLWEFPGGKLEAGETVAQALVRELREELGIEVLASAPLISIPWQYPERSVRLHALRVTEWQGEAQAREGHPLRWIDARDMDAAVMPAADAPIVTALRLPPYYIIGGAESSSRDALPGGVMRINSGQSGTNGADALRQLRMPGAGRGEIRRVAQRALVADPALRDALLLNHDIALARELDVGVHLRAAQLRELHARPLAPNAWVGASCHDAEELELAAQIGADFATLSPVRATASHPEAKPLGWEHFAALVAQARLPVYALGGVGPADLEHAQASGAQGVAGISAFSTGR